MGERGGGGGVSWSSVMCNIAVHTKLSSHQLSTRILQVMNLSSKVLVPASMLSTLASNLAPV